MSLAAVVYASLAINGVPFLMAFGLTVIVGVLLGAINGLLVVKLKITPVIATLITLSFIRAWRCFWCRTAFRPLNLVVVCRCLPGSMIMVDLVCC